MRTYHLGDRRSLPPASRILETLGMAALTVALGLVSGSPAWAWGPKAHQLVNQWAVETLPPEIRGFFEANRPFLIDHANDPNEWIKKDKYEARRHVIFLDNYGLFPFVSLPHAFRQAVERHGSGTINRNGLLPWRIGEYSLRLTNALKAGDWEAARLAAAALGHYVADAHNPLNTTKNFDGQLTGQTGLAGRFGTQLIDRYAGFLIFHPEKAARIDDPTEFAFQNCLEAHTWLERVILADRRSIEGSSGYNDDYYDRFYSQLSSIMMQIVNASVRDTGSYWFTAWRNADRPALPGR